MSYSIAFVIPYFGKLPEMFPLWLSSAAQNPDVDFLIYSDAEKPERIPQNVKWTAMTFAEMGQKANETVGFQTKLKSPYKLCDFRPCYGDIFRNDLTPYDYWGWCDIDLVFGQLRTFLTDELIGQYDKIGTLGHCVIVRNSDKMRTMYRQPIGKEFPYRTILSSAENFSFDEGGNGEYGFPAICRENGATEYWKRWFTDIYPQTFEFRHKQYRDGKAYYREIKRIQMKNGRVYVTNQDDGSVFETMYAHFQGRKMLNRISGPLSEYFVIPNRFVTEADSLADEKRDRDVFFAGLKAKKKKSILKRIRTARILALRGKLFDPRWRKYCF